MKIAGCLVFFLTALYANASASGKWPTGDISLPLQTPAPAPTPTPTELAVPPSEVQAEPINQPMLRPPQPVPTEAVSHASSTLSAPEQKKLQAEFDLETFGSGLLEQATKLRDPFKRLVNVKLSNTPISGLESFAVDEFKLLGVLSGMNRTKALILAPDGKTYFVSQNMRIGLRKGVIRKITPQSISVKEKIINLLGEEEEVDSQIRLTEDNKSQSAR